MFLASQVLKRGGRALIIRSHLPGGPVRLLSQVVGKPDPLAKRPNKVCDPYGLGGKPLPLADSQGLLSTLDDEWQLELGNKEHDDDSQQPPPPPTALWREFHHADFLAGARFVSILAALGHVNNHFPSIHLERRLNSKKKTWEVVTAVRCFTPTLQGLSHNDFHVAMVSLPSRVFYVCMQATTTTFVPHNSSYYCVANNS